MEKNHCSRCGECCLAAAPSLQQDDLPRYLNHVFNGTHLYTIRRGELVRDNINDTLKISHQEMVKLRDREPRRGCILYDDAERACTVYADRPSQCRAFNCRDGEKLKDVFSGPRLTRELMVKDPNLLRLISAHEATCNYDTLRHHVERIPEQGEPVIQEILKILQYDQDIRRLSTERLGLDPTQLDFLYGRPLTETICMFGLAARRESDGSFLLTAERPFSMSRE